MGAVTVIVQRNINYFIILKNVMVLENRVVQFDDSSKLGCSLHLNEK